MKKQKIVGIIGARGGSKGVPRKNLRDICGQPLISYSVLDSIRSKYIDETYLSTDDTDIANEGIKYGAKVPFIRPSKFATDTATDKDWITHFLKWFHSQNEYFPDYLVLLRPTTPIRDVELIDKAIETIIANPDATSLKSVHDFPESPEKWYKSNGKFLVPLIGDDFEVCNAPRQSLDKIQKPNGYVDIIKFNTILLHKDLWGKKILSFTTPYSVEVDIEEDLILIKELMRIRMDRS